MVKIIKSKDGNVFQPTKKPGLLCLAVEEIQEKVTASLDSKFAVNQSRRIAFIFRSQEQFNEIFTAMGKTAAEGLELPGIVVVKEQLTPFSATNPTQGIKYPNAAARTANLACTVSGAPVYRDTLYTTDETMEDTLVEHDNKAQIQEFVRTMNAAPRANTTSLATASPAATTTRGRRGK